ncbi:aspartyl-phosphate phosphatase Spo0E family protein [Radiobacillus kanasensis]|uniref:aspartyl-phosphate phosphatase Spo0E family protein n=1 Tax=Radiobacillus kanasensis TaxID=2844358 RepID=UPI001E4226BE|nr:aspartyl-phosphate phosphatase Spo0E family protein [Radiobacillus kanasensis]UFU00815.1 aspartyl-phosphate phosphatase Spo0E family protein [Radiobacillus kanasensis]
MSNQKLSDTLTYPLPSWTAMICLEDGQQLERVIENLRKKMYEYVSQGASQNEVLKISQQLDEKLNKLDELKRKGKA